VKTTIKNEKESLKKQWYKKEKDFLFHKYSTTKQRKCA
jgi:hypothetical protein